MSHPHLSHDPDLLELGQFDLACSSAATPEELHRGSDALQWAPAVIPGGVHESLMAAGLLPHPFYGANEEAAQWVEQATWWYRAVFDSGPGVVEGERIRLVCPVLDTVATVWLNGTRLGTHATQFRPAAFDVTDQLLPDGNELLIRFTPPLEGLEAPPQISQNAARLASFLAPHSPEHGAERETKESLYDRPQITMRRKAALSWGWDFAPRLASVGIARPPELRRERAATLLGHHVRAVEVDQDTKVVHVALDVTAEAFAWTEPLQARVVLTSPNGSRVTTSFPLAPDPQAAVLHHGHSRVTVTDARLWWTHDLGDQPLYTVSVELLGSDAQILDRATDRVGLRTVTLDRSADPEGGRSFRFVLNGIPLFARGANWVLANMLAGSVTPQNVRALVADAAHANMTMLRVWGGGIYEQDAFYEACDELGILIWQDFMFANLDYPSDDLVLHGEVTAEAQYQVTRLRNHPSLALWCGNNEVHAMHGLAQGDLSPGGWGWSFFHEVFPSVVAEYSPQTPYWPGSPWADSGPINGVLDGDRHAWEVWHGIDVGAGGPQDFTSRGQAVHFHRYCRDHGKFISEFGIHAAPELITLKRWTPPGSLHLDSSMLAHRNKDTPKNKANDLMAEETGLPVDLHQYIDFSMACQAEGLKYGIEHYRRRQPHCSGTLVWQYNDPWPGLSWSIMDHDQVPKAGYYFVQRAYQPVLASFVRTEDDDLEVWVTNSGREKASLSLRVDVATFTGQSILIDHVDVISQPGTSHRVWRTSARNYQPGLDRYAWVSETDGALEPNRLFFAPLKDLPLNDSRLDLEVRPDGEGRAEVTLTSHGYSYLARVLPPSTGIRFDRNYLDLRDGDQASILVEGLPTGFDLGQLKAATYNWQEGR
ncbi:beta-mannosidase [Streptomyces mirabilis]|uniref:beta-mannosidase n=1 Tax=Streptomyces mirabilis TaxID=68239 RepID=UPI00331E560B